MEGKTNGMCIAGFMASLVSIFIFGFYGILGIVGIALAAVGRKQAVANGQKTGLGTAGIILGIASCIAGLIQAFAFLG